MSKKHLLNEETVRKFMGLAGLKPISVNDFVNEVYEADEGDDCPGGIDPETGECVPVD